MLAMSQQTVSVHAAKTTLSRLIERALAGEEIQIRQGDAMVELRPAPAARFASPPPALETPGIARKFGAMRGRARVTKAFFEPLPEDELGAWEP